MKEEENKMADLVEGLTEGVGAIAAEIVKAPFKILGSFFDRLND